MTQFYIICGAFETSLFAEQEHEAALKSMRQLSNRELPKGLSNIIRVSKADCEDILAEDKFYHTQTVLSLSGVADARE